jgi:hypothetical protein
VAGTSDYQGIRYDCRSTLSPRHCEEVDRQRINQTSGTLVVRISRHKHSATAHHAIASTPRACDL